MDILQNTSPIGLSCPFYEPLINMAKVSDILSRNPNPREFSTPTPEMARSTSSSSATELFPNPLYPLEFLRYHAWHAHERSKEFHMTNDVRNGIDDWTYWRTEAEFWRDRIHGNDSDRSGIDDPYYWKVESGFWEKNCRARLFDVKRTELADAGYWRCEAIHWKSKAGCSHSDNDVRRLICDIDYWRCEHDYYQSDPLFSLLENAQQVDAPSATSDADTEQNTITGFSMTAALLENSSPAMPCIGKPQLSKPAYSQVLGSNPNQHPQCSKRMSKGSLKVKNYRSRIDNRRHVLTSMHADSLQSQRNGSRARKSVVGVRRSVRLAEKTCAQKRKTNS